MKRSRADIDDDIVWNVCAAALFALRSERKKPTHCEPNRTNTGRDTLTALGVYVDVLCTKSGIASNINDMLAHKQSTHARCANA